jgi:hypothetical protein
MDPDPRDPKDMEPTDPDSDPDPQYRLKPFVTDLKLDNDKTGFLPCVGYCAGVSGDKAHEGISLALRVLRSGISCGFGSGSVLDPDSTYI